jgi:DNA polymerase-4
VHPSHRDARLPPRTPRILHLDVDAFLASVEVAVHPELRGRPVVVGGSPDSRNLVMSCTYDVRAKGVRPGMRLAEARRRCPNAVFRDGDSQAANRLREEIAAILLRYSPAVEVASIDDFFVDLTGTARLLGAACDAAASMRDAVRVEVGLPLSIGIGTNPLMARLAGKLAKPGGIAEILPGHECAFLAPLPADLLPGVGYATGARLERYRIRTVGELRLVPREVLFATFGRHGLLIHQLARGVDPRAVEATHALEAGRLVRVRPPRSIRREATFEPEEGRPALVEAMLAYLVERAARELRRHDLRAGSVEVTLRYVDTRTPAQIRKGNTGRATGSPEELSFARRRPLGAPSDATDELASRARAILRALPRRRALVKNVGVCLANLSGSAGWQGSLFSDPGADRVPAASAEGAAGSRADRQRRLDTALDTVRDRLGFGRVVRGASLPLAETHPLERDGYRLRTPSLNQ